MRHGRPELDLDELRKQKVAPADFAPVLAKYEVGDLANGSLPHEEAIAIAKACSRHFTSTLRRARTSCERLGIANDVTTHELFVESPIPHTNWQQPKFGALTWSIIFRVAWLVGFAQNGEAISDAKRRGAQGADLLEKAAAEGDAFLLGHGIMNRVLGGELKRRGWCKTTSNGEDYWSFAIFEK